MPKGALRSTLALWAGLSIYNIAALAQSTAGNFVGKVLDATGAGIPGAAARLTRQETNFARMTLTDSQGDYEFRIVEPGTYTVEVEAAGFKKYTNRDVTLVARQTLRVDVALEVGSVTEDVTVVGEAPVINT